MSKCIDLTGQRFGNLLVLERGENYVSPKGKKRARWICQCDCGNIIKADTAALKAGRTYRCLECAHKATGMASRVDLTGKRYGKLVVQEMIYGEKSKSGKPVTYCMCKCDCGNIVKRIADNLDENEMSSCGCARKEISDVFSRDILNQKFGRLLVVEENKDKTPREVKCVCDCGTVSWYNKTDVMAGHTSSCGCLQRERISEVNTKDWTGYISESGVELLSQAYKNSHGTWLWNCKCYCGNEFIALPANIVANTTTSCGCRGMSSGERIIETFLKNNNIEYIRQFKIAECRNVQVLPFDFAIFKNGEPYCLIEYDGKQHEEPIDFFGGIEQFEKQKKRDIIKDNYCRENNISLHRISYKLSVDEIHDTLKNILNP